MEADAEVTEYLLQCFHEDWTDDYESWEALIDDYIAGDRYMAEQTPRALRTFLAQHDEQGLREACRDVPWNFAMMSDDGTYAGWFRMLLERIESRLQAQPRRHGDG